MIYHSRPNIDQFSRDFIEDLGLPLPVNTEVADGEYHLALFPLVTKRCNSHLGRAS